MLCCKNAQQEACMNRVYSGVLYNSHEGIVNSGCLNGIAIVIWIHMQLPTELC